MMTFDFARWRGFALFLLRVTVAAIFGFAAYAKIMFWYPLPEGMGMTPTMINLMKFLSIVEPLGALALIVGVLTRWAAAGLAIIMIGATYMMLAAGFMTPSGPGWAFPALMFVCCFLVMIFGPGGWSLSALRR